jgi:mRNA-degrading endonuclease RelE of RelBE toxin-antitoxin system
MRATRVISLSLSPRLARTVERVAELEGRTKSDLFREALRTYLSSRRIREDVASPAAMRDSSFQGDIQHLKNQPSAFRRRVGDWRILFDPDPNRHLVLVTAIERRTTTTYQKR